MNRMNPARSLALGLAVGARSITLRTVAPLNRRSIHLPVLNRSMVAHYSLGLALPAISQSLKIAVQAAAPTLNWSNTGCG
jgi:hypothetical protein